MTVAEEIRAPVVAVMVVEAEDQVVVPAAVAVVVGLGHQVVAAGVGGVRANPTDRNHVSVEWKQVVEQQAALSLW